MKRVQGQSVGRPQLRLGSGESVAGHRVRNALGRTVTTRNERRHVETNHSPLPWRPNVGLRRVPLACPSLPNVFIRVVVKLARRLEASLH